MGFQESALAAIGKTPLVALARLYSGPGRLLAKLEFLQPGGSIKDRAALTCIRLAQTQGLLRPGTPVVEMTSGNMGSALAIVCNVYGHPFTAVMSAGNSPVRAAMMRGLGADVVLVPQVDGHEGMVTGNDIAAASEEAKRIAERTGAFYVDQFRNPGTVLAHEEGTGPEIWNAVGGDIRAFVAAVGSGGTFVGTSRYLKERAPNVRCIAVEPKDCEVLAGKKPLKPRHLLQGTGYGFVPPQWDPALVDDIVAVSDEEAAEMRHLLAKKEGLYVGLSSGANVSAALRVIRTMHPGPADSVVTVLCDTGLKY